MKTLGAELASRPNRLNQILIFLLCVGLTGLTAWLLWNAWVPTDFLAWALGGIVVAIFAVVAWWSLFFQLTSWKINGDEVLRRGPLMIRSRRFSLSDITEWDEVTRVDGFVTYRILYLKRDKKFYTLHSFAVTNYDELRAALIRFAKPESDAWKTETTPSISELREKGKRRNKISLKVYLGICVACLGGIAYLYFHKPAAVETSTKLVYLFATLDKELVYDELGRGNRELHFPLKEYDSLDFLMSTYMPGTYNAAATYDIRKDLHAGDSIVLGILITDYEKYVLKITKPGFWERAVEDNEIHIYHLAGKDLLYLNADNYDAWKDQDARFGWMALLALILGSVGYEMYSMTRRRKHQRKKEQAPLQ